MSPLRNPSSVRKRLVSLGCLLFSLFGLLIFQFYKLQIIEGNKWSQEAKGQHQLVVYEPFMRGAFYSNTEIQGGYLGSKQMLVMDVPRFHLFIDPEAIPLKKKKKLYQKLLSFFSLTEKQKEKMYSQFYKKSRSRKIIPWVDPPKKEEVLKWWKSFSKKEGLPLNALYFRLDYKRSHPFGSLLGQVLHTVQEEKDKKTWQGLPTGGLETYFHAYLKGKQGKRICYRSPRHSLEMGPVLETPENGADIYLTVNHYLQAICEEELKKGVEQAEAKGGWVFMMDPFTGEVFACAQYPFFEVDRYAEYYNHPELQEHTRVRAVCDAFEPGSIMKPLTLAVCLQANLFYQKLYQKTLFYPEEKIATDKGSFPKTRFQLKDLRPKKFMNLYLALQKSSNIYPGKVVQRVIENLGEEWYREAFIEIFGLGKKTNLEIPGESRGMVPKPGRLHPNRKLEWSVPTPYSVAIGHNILLTTAQLACSYATLANGGYRVEPTFIRKIVKQQGEKEVVLFDKTASFSPKERVLSKEVTQQILQGLLLTTQRGGTSPRGDLKEYTIAGKSGTSEKIIKGRYSKEKYLSSFAGFAPAENPRFVMVVVIEEPKVKWIPSVGKNYHGGVCSAPVFKEIAQRSLQYLGVTPDPKQKEKQKQLAKMQGELYRLWNES